MNPANLEQAACKKMHPNVFFPSTEDGEEIAKEVCRRCPVREQCLAEAFRLGIASGVFGGHTAKERRRLQNQPRASWNTPKDVPTKVCSCCAVELPSDRFDRNRTRSDGLHNECKRCRASRAKAVKEKAS